MTSVTCPICDQRIMGEGTVELDRNLKEHFSAEHDIKGQMASGQQPSPTAEAEPTPEAKEHPSRLHQAELRREEQAWAPEDETVPPRPKGLGDWVKKSLGVDKEPLEKEEWAKGEGYPELIRTDREHTHGQVVSEGTTKAEGELSIHCPLCGERLASADEIGLSSELREHLEGVHQIVPQVAQPTR